MARFPFLKHLFFPYMAVIVMVAVFPFSRAGVEGLNHTYVMSFRLDHILHMVAFLPWYPLGSIKFRATKLSSRIFLLLTGLVIATLAEFVQFFIAYRSYNPMDLLANVSGIMVGFLLWNLIMAVAGNRRFY